MLLSGYVVLMAHCLHSLEVEPFSSVYMSPNVLKRLLTQKNLVQRISAEEYKQKNGKIYSVGTAANFFCLVLEGCVQVVIGKDGLKFESRSFSFFGAQAMLNARESPPSDYIPDFSAWPLSDCLLVVVSQGQYLAARRASLFEEGRNGSLGGGGDGGVPKLSGFGDRLTPTLGGKVDLFSSEWAKAETQNLETNGNATANNNTTTSRTHPPNYPIDMYVDKHSEVSKQPVGVVGNLNFPLVVAGRRHPAQRQLSDQQRLLSEESSSSEVDSPDVRILVDQGEGTRRGQEGGGERPMFPLSSSEERQLSPSTSSTTSSNGYKSTQV